MIISANVSIEKKDCRDTDYYCSNQKVSADDV